ncbi:DUF1685 domain-containing protein [Cinnamomum micranthum f. kanehirae]|uniref:DUF1685 domain-containing protein n=1 Tax=Cinnamomum micranthum f. kanehirae TaxID=337451 RepID=A0A3S3QLU1_9MAGN|nr:DUF1685 domain-containing protein [Cinnamomum micranthum f. kanehirae]
MDEEERVLSFFEVFWFYHKIFPKPPPFPPPTNPTPIQDEAQIEKPNTFHLESLHRSLSDELSSKCSPRSPDSVLPKPKFIREEVLEKRKKRGSKSLSDLELEELKGIFDLGFWFLDGEMDSRLVSIVPGLQRLKKGGEEEEEEASEESTVCRPYLSEAWSVDEREENPLMNWRVPVVCNGEEMKDRLRSWAQAVASTVR